MTTAERPAPTLPLEAPSGRVMVTGATGNVGRRVLDLLRAAGVPARAVGPSTSQLSSVLEAPAAGTESVDVATFDFTDPATWQPAYRGVERMFVLRPPHLSRPRTQMVPALEAAKSAGVEHMVLLSLQGAERNRLVPHASLEKWLRGSGLSWTFVRPSFFMQNLVTTHRSDIRDRGEIVVPAGRGATAFVDTADVAAVVAAALLAPGRHRHRAWTPTGPEALTYDEVAGILSRALGREIRYEQPGLLRYLRHARTALDMPVGMVAVTSAIYTAARLGLAAGLTDDVRRVTGREPVTFEQFAAAHVHLWRAT